MTFFSKVKVSAVLLGITLFTVCYAGATEQTKGAHDLVVFKNMQQDASLASQSCLPMVIMVSQFSCAYCEKLRAQVLLPLLKSGEFDNKALFRELLIDPDEFVINLNGKKLAGKQVASSFLNNIVTPTMLVIDSTGNQLAQPIIGISNIDYYSAYLENQINHAYQKTQNECAK